MGWRAVVPPLSPRAWLILSGDALSAVGSGLTLPFFVVYLSQVRGIELGVAGLILATTAVVGLAGNPAGGWLSDRIRARRAAIFGLVLTATGTAVLPLVDTAALGFVAAGLYGIGMTVAWPAEDALLATSIDARQRSQVFAVRHATLNIGFSVGALVAAFVVASIASPTSFVVLYLFDAVSFLLFAAVLARMSDVVGTDEVDPATPDAGDPSGAGGYRAVFRDRVFRRLWLIVLVLVFAGYTQYHAAFPLFATGVGGLSASGLGLAFAANTITVVVAQLLVLRMMVGHRRTRGVALSALFVAAAWVATLAAAGGNPETTGLLLFVAAMALFGIGETLLTPTVPAIVNDLAPERLRGRYNGAYALAWTSGHIVGPALAGFALAAGQGYALFIVLIAALGAAALGALRLERLLPPDMNCIGPIDAGTADTSALDGPAPA